MQRSAFGLAACVALYEILRRVFVSAREPQKRSPLKQNLLPDSVGRAELEKAKSSAGRNIGDVQLGPKLGSGSYGVVCAGCDLLRHLLST